MHAYWYLATDFKGPFPMLTITGSALQALLLSRRRSWSVAGVHIPQQFSTIISKCFKYKTDRWFDYNFYNFVNESRHTYTLYNAVTFRKNTMFYWQDLVQLGRSHCVRPFCGAPAVHSCIATANDHWSTPK